MSKLGAATLGLLAAAAAAQTPAPQLSLSYSAPAGCPTAADIWAGVTGLRGELTSDGVEPDVRAAVEVTGTGTQWKAQVQTSIQGTSGLRILDADSCQQLSEAVAAVLSLALATPVAPQAPAPEPPVPPVPPLVATAPLAQPEEPGVRPFVELLAGARFGVLPTVMPLGQLGGGVVWKRLRLQAHLGLSGTSSIASSLAAAAIESWFQASLGACVEVLGAVVRLEVCGEIDSALLSARGTGMADARQGSALWVAAVGGLTVRIRVWRGLAVVVAWDLGGALARPRFFVEADGVPQTIYEAPILTGRLAGGLQWQF